MRHAGPAPRRAPQAGATIWPPALRSKAILPRSPAAIMGFSRCRAPSAAWEARPRSPHTSHFRRTEPRVGLHRRGPTGTLSAAPVYLATDGLIGKCDARVAGRGLEDGSADELFSRRGTEPRCATKLRGISFRPCSGKLPSAEAIAIFTLGGVRNAHCRSGRHEAKKIATRRGNLRTNNPDPASRDAIRHLAFPAQSGLFFLARNSELT